MKVLSIILGAILIIGGFCCAFSPGATLLQTGYLIGIFLLVYGIAGIIRAISTKRYGISFGMSILGAIIGIFALFKPASTLAIDALLIYLVAGYFVINGIASVVLALNLKKLALDKMWIFVLITGVLSIIAGVYSFLHPLVMGLAIGILIGIYFVETGINLIAIALATKDMPEA